MFKKASIPFIKTKNQNPKNKRVRRKEKARKEKNHLPKIENLPNIENQFKKKPKKINTNKFRGSLTK